MSKQEASASTPRRRTIESLRGTLELLVLRTLSVEPLHGWGVSQRIAELSRDVLDVNQGALYPALHSLEKRGLVRSRWGRSETGRRARFYELTRDGHRALRREEEGWERFVAAVEQVLGAG